MSELSNPSLCKLSRSARSVNKHGGGRGGEGGGTDGQKKTNFLTVIMTKTITGRYFFFHSINVYLSIPSYVFTVSHLVLGSTWEGPDTLSLISSACCAPLSCASRAGCIYFCARVESAPTTWRIRAKEGKQARTWGKVVGFKFPLLHINNPSAGCRPSAETHRTRRERVQGAGLCGSEVKKTTKKRHCAIYSAIVLLSLGFQGAP